MNCAGIHAGIQRVFALRDRVAGEQPTDADTADCEADQKAGTR
jgi:hypothetical protein